MVTVRIGLLLLFIACPPLFAQEAGGSEETAPAAPQTAPEDIQSTGERVLLNKSADDGRIAERLGEIFRTSGWFEGLRVESRDGIVYIDGQTTSDEYKQWAGKVAGRTEDVVAVVNRVKVDEPPAINTFSLQREMAKLWDQTLRLLPLIGIGLLAVILCGLIARYLSRLLVIPITRLTDSELLQNISRKLIAVLIVLIGIIFFLRITGLTGIAVTVVSGTGLFGLILGFAFRDIAENFLASILMSVQTPFQLGDVIQVNEHLGVVHKVTARGTVLVDFDGNHIQIANATVYKSTLKNLSANPKIRQHFVLGIGYDASILAAQDTAMKVLREHSAVLDDPEPMVLVDALGAATINLKIYFWINGHEHSALKVKSSVMRKVLRSIEKAGISLPDEAREIIFPNGVPVQMIGGDASEAKANVGDAVEAKTCPDIEADLSQDATDAEGDLTSEVDEIKSQAAASREVEDGKGIVG